jgi:hypothetical protein
MQSPLDAPGMGWNQEAGRDYWRPVGLATLCRTVRRACSGVNGQALAGLVSDIAERGALARVYAHCFPDEWQGEVERGGESLLHSTRAACGVALRLVEHITRADLFPIEDWALDELQVAADGDGDADEAPRALSYIPLYPAFGFDWEPYSGGDERPSAGLLVLMALLINDANLPDLLREALQSEAEREVVREGTTGEEGAELAAGRWEEARTLLDRVASSDQIAAILADDAGAFARLGEPWASVPLLASYLVADTPNGYLNLDAESWGGAEEYAWTVENVRLLADEWTQAKVLLDRIAGAMHLLAQQEAMDILLAALMETFAARDHTGDPSTSSGADGIPPS